MTNIFPAKDFSRFHQQSAFLGGAVDIFSKKSPSSTMIYEPLFTGLEQFFTKLQRASPLFDKFLANCEFGVIANNKPNAFAWRVVDKYYIGVTSGFVHLLFETAFASLCDNDCFSWIEDGYENTKSVKISKRALREYFLHENPKAIVYVRNHLPDNLLRANIAGSLFTNAIIFTVMHEIGHCLMGHLDPSHLQTPDLISEVIDPSRRSNNEALRFFREYQADNISVLATSEYLMSERERLDGTTAERFIAWSISIDIVFWLLSKGPIIPLKDDHVYSHPHPQLRLAYKALRLSEIDDRLPIKWEKGSGGSTSISWVAITASRIFAEDWVRAGLAPKEWCVYRDDATLLRHAQEISNLLYGHEKEANEYFLLAKTDIIHELLPSFYDQSGNAARVQK